MDNNEFCDVHGRLVNVKIDKDGDILVPLSELRQTGFTLYRKSQYNKLLIDESQFTREFMLYLLGASKTYILEKRFRISEEDVINTINNCKKILLNENMTAMLPTKVSSSSDNIQKLVSTPKPNFAHLDKSLNNATSTPKANTRVIEQHEDLTVIKFQNDKITLPEPKRNSSYGKPSTPKANISENGFASPKTPQPQFYTDSNTKNEVLRPPQSFLPETPPRPPRIPTVQMILRQMYKVFVSYTDKDTIWVQVEENLNTLADIYTKSMVEAKSAKVVTNPRLNHYYMAQEDECWFRVKLLKPSPLTVFFIDYGNTSVVDELRELPSSLVSFPCQAVKIVFDNPVPAKVDDTFEIIPVEQIDDSTYSVKTEKKTETFSKLAKIETFSKLAPPIYKVSDGLLVKVLREENGCFLLKTKDGYVKTKQIQRLLENYNGNVVDTVNIGQLVVCTKNDSPGLYRAMVEGQNGNLVQVKYLEDGERNTISITTIKHITRELADEPITYIVSPKMDIFNQGILSVEAKTLLEKLAGQKCQVVLSNNNFDLLFEGQHVSKLLSNCSPKFKKLEDIPISPIKNGIGNFLVTHFNCSKKLLALISEESLEKLPSVTDDSENHKPHDGAVGEVCWGHFQGEWYRCVILKKSGEKYEALFFDFGNTEELAKDQLSEINDAATKVPILSFLGHLVNLPNNPNVDNILIEQIQENAAYDVNVIRCRGGNEYDVVIPSIQELF